MKKILLTTSALVAMSSVALAGGMVDTTPAPAPMADGFTVEASGEAELFYFYTKADGAANADTGIGGDLDFTVTASKTVEDGSTISVEVGVDTNNNVVEVEDFIIKYDSAMGTAKIGTLDADDHDVSVPGAPDVPHDEQGDDDEDYYLELIEASDEGAYSTQKIAYAKLNSGQVKDGFLQKDLALTYATPALGGFQLGLGVDTAKNLDVALAGGMTSGDVEVKVGAGIAGKYDDLENAVPRFGASVSTMGLTLGAEGDYNKGRATNELDFEVGVAYKKDAYEAGVSYKVENEATDKGLVTAGVRYEENGIEGIIAVTHDLALATNKNAVFAGVVYNSDDFDASVSYKGGQKGTDIAKGVANAGVAIKAVENLEVVISGEYNLATEKFGAMASAEYDATDALTIIAAAGYDTAKTTTAKLGAEFDVNSKLELSAFGYMTKTDTGVAAADEAKFGGELGLSYTIYTDVSFDASVNYDAAKKIGAKAGFSVEF